MYSGGICNDEREQIQIEMKPIKPQRRVKRSHKKTPAEATIAAADDDDGDNGDDDEDDYRTRLSSPRSAAIQHHM